jgi:hypothetical protein
MTYTFINTYHQFEDPDYSKRLGYGFILNELQAAVGDKRIPTFETGKLSFKIYKLNEYPNRGALETFVAEHWANRNHELWFYGKQYNNLDELIKALGEAGKMIIELTVEVD